MLTLVSLDRMQNISTLMRKSYSSETGLTPPVKYFY